jgi:hypothetical protein
MSDEVLLDWVEIARVREDDDMEEFLSIKVADSVHDLGYDRGFTFEDGAGHTLRLVEIVRSNSKGTNYCLRYGEGRSCPQAVTGLLLSKE